MGSKRTITQRVRVSPDEDEAWRAAARTQEMGVSELLRTAMGAYLLELGARQLEDQEARQRGEGDGVTTPPGSGSEDDQEARQMGCGVTETAT